MSFSSPLWMAAIVLMVPFAVIFYRLGRRLGIKRLHRFIAPALHTALVSGENAGRRRVRLVLFCLAMVFLALSLARPLLHEREEEVKRMGVDFMIALDTSNSMLVRDVPPDHNRLAAAKRAIRELMGRLSGDRVGIIGFAGQARMLTPMTFNYQTLELVLDGVGTDTIWQQGTNLGQAIKTAARVLRKRKLESRVLVIISDGGSLEGDPVIAAREANVEDNLTIFTVGIGSAEGGRIPVERRDEGGNVIATEYLKDIDDNPVVSALDEQTLQGIAQATGGAYVRLVGRHPDTQDPSVLAELYDSQIQPLAASLRVANVVARVEVFQIPLAVALALLLAQTLVFERKRRAGAATLAVLCAGLLFGGDARAGSAQGKLFIPHAEHPIRVDGDLNDWRGIEPMPLPFMDKDTSRVQLAWRESGLYGVARWERGTVEIDRARPWRGDSFELFIEKDNAQNHDSSDADHEVEQYIFIPDVGPADEKATGPGYWMVPRGLHHTEGVRLSEGHKDGGEGIACMWGKTPWLYWVEFCVPAPMLKPAAMESRTKITLHFSLNEEGWPVQQFAVDKNVNQAYRRPITWRTVMLEPREEDRLREGEEPSPEPPPAEPTEEPEEEAEPAALTRARRGDLLAEAEKLMKDDRPGAAAELLRRKLLKWPKDPYLLYNYGVASYADGRYMEAESAWTSAALKNEKHLTGRMLLQLGNTAFRQAYAMKPGPRTWHNALMLYRRAGDYYEQLEGQKSGPREAALKNLNACRQQIIGVYLERGNWHRGHAEKIRKSIADDPKLKVWQIHDLIEELIKEAQKAKSDFQELLAAAPGHEEAEQALERVDAVLEYGLLAKARALRREVDEAGSTQNEVWTIEKYREALTYYDRALALNPDREEARREQREVREATRDVYLSEASVERNMAREVLNERVTERDLEKQIAEMEKLPGAEKLTELGGLRAKLRWVKKRYPPSDPEEAIKHWENAARDYEIALTFTPDDALVEKKATELEDIMFRHRKKLAGEYVAEAEGITVTNDEEADAEVKRLELAVKHLKRAAQMRPDEAPAVAERLEEVKGLLARSYKRRGDIYRGLAEKRRVEFLDRAVAYMEKAGQDYVFAHRTDPDLKEAAKAHKKTMKELMEMRVELSDRIAAQYQEEADEGVGAGDEAVQIDASKLRELALQKREESLGPTRTYETVERPEPVNNW